MAEGPFCIVYMHSTVQKEDNSPGLTMLRWIYEELPEDYKDRLQVVYFIHPGLRSRLVFATLGRFLLSGGLVLSYFSTQIIMVYVLNRGAIWCKPLLIITVSIQFF